MPPLCRRDAEGVTLVDRLAEKPHERRADARVRDAARREQELQGASRGCARKVDAPEDSGARRNSSRSRRRPASSVRPSARVVRWSVPHPSAQPHPPLVRGRGGPYIPRPALCPSIHNKLRHAGNWGRCYVRSAKGEEREQRSRKSSLRRNSGTPAIGRTQTLATVRDRRADSHRRGHVTRRRVGSDDRRRLPARGAALPRVTPQPPRPPPSRCTPPEDTRYRHELTRAVRGLQADVQRPLRRGQRPAPACGRRRRGPPSAAGARLARELVRVAAGDAATGPPLHGDRPRPAGYRPDREAAHRIRHRHPRQGPGRPHGRARS